MHGDVRVRQSRRNGSGFAPVGLIDVVRFDLKLKLILLEHEGANAGDPPQVLPWVFDLTVIANDLFKELNEIDWCVFAV
jgi:hypothetical protein